MNRATPSVRSVFAITWGALAWLVAAANPTAGAEHAEASATPPNRLIHETSPYLLQHAHNPVRWFPWSEEAFAQARQQHKPVFVSVGYSTCYWCHVMEQESFNDPEVARVLNERYIAIKVDREERPEVDEHLLQVTQTLTGRAGWPNSVWLTPAGAPWAGCAYLPRDKFLSQLNRAADTWYSRPDDVDRQAASLVRRLKKNQRTSTTVAKAAPVTTDVLAKAQARVLRTLDPSQGGWRGTPKFPPHGPLALLLRQDRENADPAALEVVTRTLDAMWLGGLHDHVGGGFHRYAVDERWLVPHFEKMLPDNAQLLTSFADAYRRTGRSHYREAVADIYAWVEREMTSTEGAFHAAIDAGGIGREGETYVWQLNEVLDLLGPSDGGLFADIYQIKSEGNFVPETSSRRDGTNIPHLNRPLDVIARERGEDAAELARRLASLRQRLLAHRQTRPQPHCDDKIIAGWNGLMIGALAHAGRTLQEPRYIQSATRAAHAITRLLMQDGTLHRTHRSGQSRHLALLEDHAFVADGYLKLYRATQDPSWLAQAETLAVAMVREFGDEISGGFYATPISHDPRIPRTQDLRGSSNLPDADGVAAGVLLELAHLTGKQEYARAAQRALEFLVPRWKDPLGSEHALIAASTFLHGHGFEDHGTGNATTAAIPDFIARAEVVTIEAYQSKKRLRPGESFDVAIALVIEPGWHLYGDGAEDLSVPVAVSYTDSAALRVERLDHPPAQKVFDSALQRSVGKYTGRVWFRLTIVAEADAPLGAAKLPVRITTQACDDERCLAAHTTDLPITVWLDPTAEAETRHADVFEQKAAAPRSE